MEVDETANLQSQSQEGQTQSGPKVTDVTEDLDGGGYDGDVENEQLPDEIEEPDDEMSDSADLTSITQDEASLIKGFRDLSTAKKKDSRQFLKRQPPKRSYSQMVSDTDSDSYVVTTMSRASTPSKRREIRRLKSVYHPPATPTVESNDNMDIDIISSPVPRSEGF